jgi:hypothetical protein
MKQLCFTRRSLKRRRGRALALIAPCVVLSSCLLSREITISSEPPGARAWVGRELVGATPVKVDVPATGSIENQTFNPEYVTVRLDGYEEEVRQLQYRWSRRNVVLSIPFVLGVPGILLWGKLPEDLHVSLVPEGRAD